MKSVQVRIRITVEELALAAEASGPLTRAESRRVQQEEVLSLFVVAGRRAMAACMTCSMGVHCDVHGPGVVKKDAPVEKAEQRYAAAYAAGQEDASGKAFAPPTDSGSRIALISMARTHAFVRALGGDPEPLNGALLLDWFRKISAAYRRARGEAAEFEAGFSPRSCLKWLNAGRPDASAGRIVSTRQQAPAGGRTWNPKESLR